MADLSSSFAGLQLKSPVFNAAGPKCTTLEDLQIIGRSESGAIMTKSCTVMPREGNPEPRYYDLPGGSINSMGLPNLGYQEYVRIAPELREFKKPIIASVSGLSLEDNVTIMEAMNNSVYDVIELNLSCPNVPGKPQIGYDLDAVESYLTRIYAVATKPVGLKLPPYFDFVHFERAAEILKPFPIAFLSCVNSIGNALVIDPEKEEVVIKPKGGFGGLGGIYLKPTALANVRKFSELLPNIPIIGVGGIYSGTDVFEFILAGATAVQVGTAFMQEGPGCFERISRELAQLMDKKGYQSLADFRGKLRVID